MRVLWLIAAFMQLAAVTLYYTIGFGLGFVLVQGFVVVTCALAIFEVWSRAKS